MTTHGPAMLALAQLALDLDAPHVTVFAAAFETALRYMHAEPEGMAGWLRAVAAELDEPLSEEDREDAWAFLRLFAELQGKGETR